MGVVDDFVAHIDGGTELEQGAIHNFNGAVHTGTEAARLGQGDFGLGVQHSHHSTPMSLTSKRTDGAVLFDFNHPLAGQPVTFEVEIIGII
jgi:hypothetical protein